MTRTEAIEFAKGEFERINELLHHYGWSDIVPGDEVSPQSLLQNVYDTLLVDCKLSRDDVPPEPTWLHDDERRFEKIYSGKGELLERQTYWTKRNGEIVGRDYITRVIRKKIREAGRTLKADEEVMESAIETCLAEKWLVTRGGQLVGSIIRASEDQLLSSWLEAQLSA